MLKSAAFSTVLKKVLALVVICTAAGCAVNCVLIVLCAAHEQHSGQRKLIHIDRATSEANWPAGMDIKNSCEGVIFYGTGPYGFGCDALCLKIDRQISEGGSGPNMVVVHRFGWPMRAAYWSELYPTPHPQLITPATDVPNWMYWNKRTSWRQKIPLSAYWGGFAVNTVVFAGTAFVMWLPMGIWKRARRKARGMCERCGYDLRGNVEGRCPECGK
ncbi:MAG TPA: hypothetical protein VG711_11485 [Phycisphaerales bacterium]|nr:hypothetical protein [Phycisphaerales bacterium]